MKKRLISILKYLAFLFVGLALVWYVFRDQDLNKIADELKHANYYWIAFALAISMLSHLSRAVRWNIIIRQLGFKPRLLTTFGAVMIGYVTNFLIPRAGEIAKCSIIKRYEKVPMESLLGTVVIERFADLAMLIVIIVLAVLLQVRLLGGFLMKELIDPLFGDISTNGSVLLVYLLVILGSIGLIFLLYKFFKRRLIRSKYFYKIKRLIVGFIIGLKTVRQMKSNPWFIAHTVFIWTMYFLMGYIAFFALESTSDLSLLAGLSIIVLASLGIIAPVPSGIGAYHYLVSKGLVLYGIEEIDGLTYATMTHSMQAIMVIIIGGIFLILMPFLMKNKVRNKD